MKTIYTALLIFIFTFSVNANQEYYEKIPVKKGQLVKLNMRTGATIEISTWNEDFVEALAEIKKCTGGECQLSINKKSFGVEIKSEIEKENYNSSTNTDLLVKLKVPENFNVEISSSGGRVSISGLEGDIKGGTGGGKIILVDCNAEGEFNTGGGGLLVKGGKLNFNFNTGGGSIKIKDAEAGGRFNTGGGSIYVENSELDARFSTGGGEVKAENISGNIKVGTGAGDVVLSMSRDVKDEEMRISVGTGSGDVNVRVPEEVNPEIDIELAYTQGNEGYEIISDFDIEIEETKEWDEENGTPRKYIFGKASGESNLRSISIRNVNGDVIIEKY